MQAAMCVVDLLPHIQNHASAPRLATASWAPSYIHTYHQDAAENFGSTGDHRRLGRRWFVWLTWIEYSNPMG